MQGHTNKNHDGSGGIRTHASEETGALNQRLRPLGHATYLSLSHQILVFIAPSAISVLGPIFPVHPSKPL
jgi:hypothetical protein